MYNCKVVVLDTRDREGESETDMWNGYSARDAAQFVGLSESAVRSCVRAGLLASGSKTGLGKVLSFRDVKVLRLIKALTGQGVSMQRVRRQLGALKDRLPTETSLSVLAISSHSGHVIVRDEKCAWHADNGQLVFPFSMDAPTGDVAAIATQNDTAGVQAVPGMTADEWFAHAMDLEEEDPPAAIRAYQRLLRLRPDCTEALVNLGRLHAELGQPQSAAESFTQALVIDPDDSTALYNLGVLAQDSGHDDHAISLYRKALTLDTQLAEAHYNLATIFDRTGDLRAAIRHINEYRKLTKRL